MKPSEDIRRRREAWCAAIRQAIRNDECTLARIAEAVEVHPVTLRQFNAGTDKLGLPALDRLAELLDVKRPARRT